MEGEQVAEIQEEVVLVSKEEIKNEADQIKLKLKELLRIHGPDKKAKIIDNLPDNFWQDYQENIFLYKKRQQTYLDLQKRRGTVDFGRFPNGEVPEMSDIETEKLGKGKIFEQIVAADPEIVGKKETEAGKELRNFLADPMMYFFTMEQKMQLGYLRNPDLAIVDEELGLINGWVECKTPPHLDERAYNQLRGSGFRRSFEIALKIINETSNEELRNCRLLALAELKDKLKFADNLNLIIVVPNNPRFSLNKAGVLYSQQVALKIDLLPTEYDDRSAIDPKIRTEVMNVLNDYEVKVSPFTREQLDLINKYLIGRFRGK